MLRLTLLLAVAPALALALSCLNENGAAVEWWSIIKLAGGAEYVYADAANEQYVKSSNNVQGTGGALIYTLTDAFRHSFALYNDETPDGKQCSACGHTKGVVAVDESLTGFWLVHSTPKFPTQDAGTYMPYPDSGLTYGQAMLCVSLKGAEFDVVGDAMLRNRPQVYNATLSSKVASSLPTLKQACDRDYDSSPTGLATTLTAIKGKQFTVFSKTGPWAKDLYSDLIAPHFKSSIHTETWMNGVNPMPNYCTPTYAYNTLNIQTYVVAGNTVTNTKDHSKMTLVQDGKHVCIGDINRMVSQTKRGGGSVCIESAALSRQLNAQVAIWGPDSPRGGCS